MIKLPADALANETCQIIRKKDFWINVTFLTIFHCQSFRYSNCHYVLFTNRIYAHFLVWFSWQFCIQFSIQWRRCIFWSWTRKFYDNIWTGGEFCAFLDSVCIMMRWSVQYEIFASEFVDKQFLRDFGHKEVLSSDFIFFFRSCYCGCCCSKMFISMLSWIWFGKVLTIRLCDVVAKVTKSYADIEMVLQPRDIPMGIHIYDSWCL